MSLTLTSIPEIARALDIVKTTNMNQTAIERMLEESPREQPWNCLAISSKSEGKDGDHCVLPFKAKEAKL